MAEGESSSYARMKARAARPTDGVEVELIRDNSNQNSFGTYVQKGETLKLVIAGKTVAVIHGDGTLEVTDS